MERINNVGELITFLKEQYSTNTPISCEYVDIKGEGHNRPLLTNSFNRTLSGIVISMTY